ncbi:hypothetical protein BX666DRAFT_1860636 [Dichotomocladium elegans]|nr:hypothetical protein BX666DRAFT_1860636 [Dichotomocladium elegans]
MNHLAVYGGAGALGRTLVNYFKERGWYVTNIDLIENPAANGNALVNSKDSLAQQAAHIEKSLASVLDGHKLKALFCVAGGWAGGNAADKGFLDSVELMMQQSVHSSVISAQLATRHMGRDGLVVLTGAAAALGPTPGMIAYGMAKASVHHLVKDLAVAGSGLPESVKTIGICPVTLDTPMNRKSMPGADYSSWTPLEAIAKQLHGYATGSVPVTNGSLIEVITKAGETKFTEK